jgi:hypothetical protein
MEPLPLARPRLETLVQSDSSARRGRRGRRGRRDRRDRRDRRGRT